MNAKIIISLLFVITGCATSPRQDSISQNVALSDADANYDLILQAPTKLGQEFNDQFIAGHLEDLRQLSTDELVQNPRHVEALNGLAIYYFKKGILESSAMLLNKALSIEPASGMTLNNLGVVYFKQGLERDSVLVFAKAIEIQPKNKEAILNLASLFEKNRDYDKAIGLYDQIDKKIFSGEVGLNAFATAYGSRNQYPQAENIYKMILQKNSQSAKTLFNYAYLKIEKMQDYSGGKQLLEKLKQVDSRYQANATVAQLEEKLQQQVKK